MENLFKLATEVASTSPSKKKVGAILLKKNRVIVCATNNETKTHPIQAHWAKKVGRPQKIFLHAILQSWYHHVHLQKYCMMFSFHHDRIRK